MGDAVRSKKCEALHREKTVTKNNRTTRSLENSDIDGMHVLADESVEENELDDVGGNAVRSTKRDALHRGKTAAELAGEDEGLENPYPNNIPYFQQLTGPW